MKPFLFKLISLSSIPEEYYETAMKCLFELLLQPENFSIKKRNSKENIMTRFYKFSVHRLPSPFLKNDLKQSKMNLENDEESSWDFKFLTKKELFDFILRQDKLTKKYENDLKQLKKWEVDDESTEETPISEMFNEESILSLSIGRSNIMEEIRRIIEKTDQFTEIPQEIIDLDIDSEIQRLNFGGMPVQTKCLGEQVSKDNSRNNS
jgi:glutamyl/glutaminyl-tRNA synthetase